MPRMLASTVGLLHVHHLTALVPQVDQLSVVAMAGAASEAMKFDDVVGQNAGK